MGLEYSFLHYARLLQSISLNYQHSLVTRNSTKKRLSCTLYLSLEIFSWWAALFQSVRFYSSILCLHDTVHVLCLGVHGTAEGCLVMYVKHGWFDGAVSDGGDVFFVWFCCLFFTEILILSKYSEEISAHAQRINSSQMQLLAFWGAFIYFCLSSLPENCLVSFNFVSSNINTRVDCVFPLHTVLTWSSHPAFSLHPCLPFYSHFTVWNLPPPMLCPRHTHAFCFGW